MNQELPDVQAGLANTVKPEIKLPTFAGSWRKQGSSIKISASASVTTLKPFTAWITTKCGKLLKRQEYQTTLPVSWETCMQAKKQQLDLEMKQMTDPNLKKEYNKPVYCHPAYLNSMQSTSWEIPGCMSYKLDQDCQEKYQQPQICFFILCCNGRKVKRN